MILLLYEWMKLPAVFAYSSTRMILAALTTLLFTIVMGPACIRKLYQLKTGQSIRVEDCPMLAELHQKKKDTPSMGGILILGAMLISALLWMDLKSPYTLILIFVTLSLGMLGGVDDYLKQKHKNSKGLKARWKFGIQIGVASLIALYLYVPQVQELIHFGNWFPPMSAKEQARALSGSEFMGIYFVPFLKGAVVTLSGAGLILAALFTIFVVTGASNAVNLTDGLDGLASGCLVMVSIVLGVVAFLSNHLELARYLNILYIEGSGEVAVYLFGLIGACLGFLWYNGYPAQIFMGDTGSLALGGIIGICAVLLRRELLLGLAGAVFVAEALSVILQVGSYRLRNKKRIFLCAPLHHHFEYKGWPETKVVLRFWIVSLIFAILAIGSLKFQ